jgi:polysaccharide pyruvyl transferase WcaK-like protein
VRDYLATVVPFIREVAGRGRDVVIVVGDEGDRSFAADIARASNVAGSGDVSREVRVSPAATLGEIMEEMAGADLVVATRFHHVVCALKMGRPTVSIGYAAKNRHLMDRFGLGDFALAIEEIDLPELCRAAQEVQARRAELEPLMRRALDEVVDDLAVHVHDLPLGSLSGSRS